MATTDRERLRQSEARFHALVDAITDYAIFLLDDEGRVSSWNPGAERIKGYSEEEVQNRHFSIFYPQDDVAAGKPERELRFALRDGRFEEDGWRVRKDGTRFLANVVITPVRDEEGELLGFAKVTRDITDRAKALETAMRLRLIEDRERMASRMHMTAISMLFELGMDLQSLALQTHEARTREHLEAAVVELDDVIAELRAFIFHPEKSGLS